MTITLSFNPDAHNPNPGEGRSPTDRRLMWAFYDGIQPLHPRDR